MTTLWYYDYYEKGVFPHQQKLCKAVELTCNLEGRRVVHSTNIQMSSNGTEKEYQTIALTEIPTNPLTLRLRTLQKALNQLEEELNSINAEIKELTIAQLDEKEFSLMKRTFNAQDSQLETGGAPIEEISFNGNKTIRFHYDIGVFRPLRFFY